METATMGKVLANVKIENLNDLLKVKEGTLAPDQVRTVQVPDALVDTGSKLLGLPRRYIDQLGLEKYQTREARTAAGLVPTNLYRAVWLTVEGRQCTVDVAEVHDDASVLIGYVPLELLDFTVDPIRQRLVPIPQDGGQQVLDLY
jgi:predicted aspartyl protease